MEKSNIIHVPAPSRKFSHQDVVEMAMSAFRAHYPMPDIAPGYLNFNDLPQNFKDAWNAAVDEVLKLAPRLAQVAPTVTPPQ